MNGMTVSAVLLAAFLATAVAQPKAVLLWKGLAREYFGALWHASAEDPLQITSTGSARRFV